MLIVRPYSLVLYPLIGVGLREGKSAVVGHMHRLFGSAGGNDLDMGRSVAGGGWQ